MKTFLKSEHCLTKTHCLTCRDRLGGRPWRQALLAIFGDLQLPDFPCPLGKPWYIRAEVPLMPVLPPFGALVAEIAALPSDKPQHRLLKALASQLQDLYRRPGGGSCGCAPDAFHQRLTQKLRFLYTQYASHP